MKPHIKKINSVWQVSVNGKPIEFGSKVSIAWDRYFLVTWHRSWDIYKRTHKIA